MNSAEFQAKMQAIQTEFQAKVQEAMMSGKGDQIPALVAEMQARMQEITAEMQAHVMGQMGAAAAPAAAAAPKVYGDDMTSLDLHKLAYPSDMDFFARLPSNPVLMGAIREIHESGARARGRRRMLASAMRLTPNVSRGMFEIVDRCRETLNLKMPMDLFVVQDRMFNAGIFPISDGKLTIYFTSGLLENFKPAELAFVIGHEMGHAMFRHIDVPVEPLIHHFSHALSPKDVIRLRSWQRAGELSADRAGLLCSRDFKSACEAFFKLSSGITSESFQFSIGEYMEQYSELESYIKGREADQMDEFYSTHPLNPIRLKALELFSQSEVYHELGNSSGGSLKTPEMEGQIKAFMKLMEPGYLDEQSEIGATIREFMFLAGFMVAKSDGNVDPKEVEGLAKLLNTPNASDRVKATLELEDETVIEQLCQHANKIRFEMPPVQRLNIIRDVFTIATSDGKITEDEIHEMCKVCGVMEIGTGFLEDLLANVTVEESEADMESEEDAA